MGLRVTLNQNTMIATVFSALVLIVCMFLIARGFLGSRAAQPGDVYYYDLNTGKVFVAPASRVEPIEAPSGAGPDGKPAGVRAYINSCDTCPDLNGMDINQIEQTGALLAYLVVSPPLSVEEPGAMRLMPEPLIRAVDGGPWVPIGSPEGLAMSKHAKGRCASGSGIQTCHPR